jgi:hypothetical protein
MSHYPHAEPAATFARRRPISWRLFFQAAIDMARTRTRHRQQRQELLDYLASDHRAAADLGVNANDARAWAERPFREA